MPDIFIQSTTSHARLATGSLTVMAAFAKNFRMTDSYCKARCPLPSLIAMCLNNSRPSASLTLTPLQETWYRVGMAVDLRRRASTALSANAFASNSPGRNGPSEVRSLHRKRAELAFMVYRRVFFEDDGSAMIGSVFSGR